MDIPKLSNEENFKRYLYLCNSAPKYISGPPEKYSIPHITHEEYIFNEYLKTSPKDLLNILQSSNSDKLLPKRTILFYTLARILHHESAPSTLKTEINSILLGIIKTDEEFFDFIKYYTGFRKGKTKISTTLRKNIHSFYKKKTPLELANSYALFKSYHGWTHKSLIKFSHFKSDSPTKNFVINYILFGKPKTENNDNIEKTIIDTLENGEKIRKTKEPNEVIPLVNHLIVTHKQLRPDLLKHPEVWEAIIPQLDLRDILSSLSKLYKLGLLKVNSNTHGKIIESLTNVEKVKTSNLHPVEIFILLKDFEKGGRPMDPQLLQHLIVEKKLNDEQLMKIKTMIEPKCPNIISGIHKCLTLSYSNLSATGKKYLITFDTSNKADLPCLNRKNVMALEGALAIATSILKVEKDVSLAVYKEKDVHIVNLEKAGHFQDNLKKLKENKVTYFFPMASVEWAEAKNKHFDIFINFIHHHEYCNHAPKEVKEKIDKSVDILNRYRKKVNEKAKLVTICLSSTKLNISDGSPGFIDIVGLDVDVPRVLEAFCRGIFS